jgi:hypothetical protein
MNAHEIYKAILTNPELDDADLDLLHTALNTKRKRLAKERANGVKVGDRVRLRGVKPKYMDGREGTIVGKIQRPGVASQFEVELDEQPPGTRYGRKLILKPIIFEVIS